MDMLFTTSARSVSSGSLAGNTRASLPGDAGPTSLAHCGDGPSSAALVGGRGRCWLRRLIAVVVGVTIGVTIGVTVGGTIGGRNPRV